jgi:hypothetical protein
LSSELSASKKFYTLLQNHIQVNFCKNVECGHFGQPASPEKQPRGPGANERPNDGYILGVRSWTIPSAEKASRCALLEICFLTFSAVKSEGA